jgi:NADPH-dependent 2,4-dienoyl-CoA reductase/sulfur reductase-like enzyme
LRNVADAIRIRRFIEKSRARRAVVVGAGLVSLEMCEAFRCLDLETTLVHRGELPMHRLGREFAQRILQELEGNGVAFLGDARLEAFEGASNRARFVHTSHGSLEADLILLGIGVVPSVALAAEAGLALGSTGAIAVDEQMQTSVPSIHAAGDCRILPPHQPEAGACATRGHREQAGSDRRCQRRRAASLFRASWAPSASRVR